VCSSRSVATFPTSDINFVRCPGHYLGLRVISPCNEPNGTTENFDDRLGVAGANFAYFDIRVTGHSGMMFAAYPCVQEFFFGHTSTIFPKPPLCANACASPASRRGIR